MEERDHGAEVGGIFELKRVKERAWRLEAENKELKRENELLNTRFDAHVEMQSDMLRSLKQEIQSNHTKIEELDTEIAKLNRELTIQKTTAEEDLQENNAQWESKYAVLQDKNEQLTRELNEINTFRQNKDHMEAELARLNQKLEEQEEGHNSAIDEFERRKAIDIDNLKKDMLRNLRETREMLRAKTKDQLDQTTKRTIMENEQMVTELHFHNKTTERVLSSNKKLADENAQLKRNLQIHKDLENELARRTHVYQKLIKKMDQKQKADLAAKEQSKELLSSDAFEQEMPTLADVNMSRELGGVSRELPSIGSTSKLSDEAAKLQRQLESVQNTLGNVRHEFAHYKRDHATLTQLQDQSTRLIISALYELRNQRECEQFPPASYDEQANWAFANMTPKQKEYFFRVLLEKLNSSMCGNCFPTGPGVTSCQHGGNSSSSLPAINRSPKQGDQANFSQFLWSVATHGGAPPPSEGLSVAGKEIATKSVQTETSQADPCLQEGLWNPAGRTKKFGGGAPVSADVVTSGVRTWGPRAASQRSKGLGRVV